VTVLPRPASPKKVGSARSEASGSPRPKALALHVDDDTVHYYTGGFDRWAHTARFTPRMLVMRIGATHRVRSGVRTASRTTLDDPQCGHLSLVASLLLRGVASIGSASQSGTDGGKRAGGDAFGPCCWRGAHTRDQLRDRVHAPAPPISVGHRGCGDALGGDGLAHSPLCRVIPASPPPQAWGQFWSRGLLAWAYRAGPLGVVGRSQSTVSPARG